MKIATKGLISSWIFFVASIGFSGTFFDDFSDALKVKRSGRWSIEIGKSTMAFIGLLVKQA